MDFHPCQIVSSAIDSFDRDRDQVLYHTNSTKKRCLLYPEDGPKMFNYWVANTSSNSSLGNSVYIDTKMIILFATLV